MSQLITFFAGILVGWFITHYYSVNMKMPQLRQNGGGSDRSFGLDSRTVYITIENELRHLGIRLPVTIILGKPIRTIFGNQIIERNIARRCTANLFDENSKFICQLWWRHGKEILPYVDINSGETSSLIVFMNNKGAEEYFPYQPTSQSDFKPLILKVPKFNQSKNFSIIISYSFGSKNLNIPVKVFFDYRRNVYFESGGGSSFFFEIQ